MMHHKYLRKYLRLGGMILVALALLAAPRPAAAQVSHEDAEPGFDFKYIEPDDAGNARPDEMPPLPVDGADASAAGLGYQDDVNRWTTAFEPANLDHLSPIEMPQTSDRWIRVDLSEQTVIAYEGSTPVRGFIVSTGLPDTPTVTGTFYMRTKVRSQTMTGGSQAQGTYYSLDNVEWVQYFYAAYGFHGTWWHYNFGVPMSHGCINMTNADAKWLFDWAGPVWDGESIWMSASRSNPGTLVIVHD